VTKQSPNSWRENKLEIASVALLLREDETMSPQQLTNPKTQKLLHFAVPKHQTNPKFTPVMKRINQKDVNI